MSVKSIADEQVYPDYPPFDKRFTLTGRALNDWVNSGKPNAAYSSAALLTHPKYLRGVSQGLAWQPGRKFSVAQSNFAIEFDSAGWPLHPFWRPLLNTGVVIGPGAFWHLGPNLAADAVVVHQDSSGAVRLLVIKRRDTGDWALPGGMWDPKETIFQACLRELSEEANLLVGGSLKHAPVKVYAGLSKDPRNTLHAWAETTAFLLNVHDSVLGYKIHSGDDAQDVRWAEVDDDLLANLYSNHGELVRAALARL